MARELPRAGGVFVQMEDEIASMAAVLGASMGGVKAMTATSGPGFSLKQENLGYGALAEIPCVVVDVMRGGPSTGMPTRPAQGDVMQARWGSHGDRPVVALAPASVAEVYGQTIRAFNLAEALRTPVILLYDEVVGHLIESVALAPPAAGSLVERKWATGPAEGWRPYAETEDCVPAMARPGDGYRAHMTGLTHAETGFPTQDPHEAERGLRRLLRKLEVHRARIESFEARCCDDAQVLVVAYGIAARAATRAVDVARAKGVKAGLFRPITLWPFPEAAFRDALGRARAVVVPEMNAGQLSLEIERIVAGRARVAALGKLDGEAITPAEIVTAIEEAGRHD